MGDVVGVDAGLADAVPPGLEVGNANVGEGEDVDVGVANGGGLGVSVGVGGGGIVFSQ
jgi:hypothetical protein